MGREFSRHRNKIYRTSSSKIIMSLERIKSAVESLYVNPASTAADPLIAAGSKPAKGGAVGERSKASALRAYPGLSPVHVKETTSLLATAEHGSSREIRNTDFRGILNLFFIILFVLNVRLVVENIMRYGPLLEPPRIGLFDSPLIFLGYVLVLGIPFLAFVSERYIAMKSRLLANMIQGSVVFITVALPYVIVVRSNIHPLRSLFLLMASVVYAMKIGSYWHCCSNLHDLSKSGELKSLGSNKEQLSEVEKDIVNSAIEYPQCLSIKQMYMFVAYPTLVFQLSYPRTESVRLRLVLRYLAELVFCFILQFILVEQYITPILTNAIKGVNERIKQKEDALSVSWFLLERLLKLSIPNLYIWLLMFAELFHCWLNLLAELTRFGDRRFYLDWWNAVSIRDYWQKWNMPVHNWLVRHMYKPMRKRGYPGHLAGFLIFLFSGVIHEYLIVTPIGITWTGGFGIVLVGFLLQIPLVSLTDMEFVKQRPTLGNVLFWVSWCFTGQPLAVLVYSVAASSPTVITKLIQWLVYGVAHDEL